jgi:uncharacterized membrane protein HdeD (DUF308 family)
MSQEWKWVGGFVMLLEFATLVFLFLATFLSGIASDSQSKINAAKLLNNSAPFGLIAGVMGLLMAFVAQKRGEGWWSVVAGILGVILILWSLCIPLVGLSNIRAKTLEFAIIEERPTNV